MRILLGNKPLNENYFFHPANNRYYLGCGVSKERVRLAFNNLVTNNKIKMLGFSERQLENLKNALKK